MSSFDDQQKYGLPEPIDSILQLQKHLQHKHVTGAKLDKGTGDLFFYFDGEVELQIFSFTGYEDWDIHFPDGTGEYSNYARSYAALQ